MRQNPSRLYAAFVVDQRGAPSFERLPGSDLVRWNCVALTAAGLDMSRIGHAYKALADQLVNKGPSGRPVATVQGDPYWQLRLWGAMAEARRGAHQPDAEPAALVLALGHSLLGALEQPGDRPVASALMHSIGAAAVAGFGLAGAQVGPAQLQAVARSLDRIAACYDLLEDGEGEPRREGKLLRSAAYNVANLAGPRTMARSA